MARFSEFIQYPQVVRLRSRLLPLSFLRQAAAPEAQQEGIVSQDQEAGVIGPPHAPVPHLTRLFSLTARLGVLGLVFAVMWWAWPRGDVSRLTLASDIEQEAATQPASLAVVNPANIARGEPPAPEGSAQLVADPTQQAAWFNSIIVVTPTSPVLNAMPTAADAVEPRSVSALLGNRTATTSTAAELELAPSSALSGSDTLSAELEIPAMSAPDNDEILVAALAVESKPLVKEEGGIQAEIVLLPTATPTPTPLPETSSSLLGIPKVEIVPALGLKATPTPELPTPTPIPVFTPTATPAPVGPGRLWSTFMPKPAPQSDHFWIGNPFADFASNRFPSPNYQFGSTAGNRYRPHHGVDISNPQGTPIRAAVEGEVVHAGLDDPEILGPYPNFYGQAVVIRLERRLPVAGGELDVYLLYGHMSEVQVTVGQRVKADDVVGLVGMTGIAIGPHLHIEVRLGANTYDHSVNPYLWVQPSPGNGAVAVRILTKDGRTWAGAKVSIARFDQGRAVWARQIETYLDTEKIGPDPAWGENGAMGDVPAGFYYLIGTVNGEDFRAEFPVNAGETTFIEIRTTK